LASVQGYWKEVVERHFGYDEMMPVVLLGLGRDVRQKEDYDGKVRAMATEGALAGEEEDEEGLVPRTFVYPQEGLRVAQEMRCDMYCECSALTGEVSGTPDFEMLIPQR